MLDGVSATAVSYAAVRGVPAVALRVYSEFSEMASLDVALAVAEAFAKTLQSAIPSLPLPLHGFLSALLQQAEAGLLTAEEGQAGASAAWRGLFDREAKAVLRTMNAVVRSSAIFL
jgi:predicted alpha/beta hydrolase